MASGGEIILPARDYDLDATLGCGQAFGWERDADGWSGVVQGRWVRLTASVVGQASRLSGWGYDCHAPLDRRDACPTIRFSERELQHFKIGSMGSGIKVQLAEPVRDIAWLEDYLQTNVNIGDIIATFPKDDEHLREAVKTCAGLRLVRQEPWECLASFILSSTKQIVQIRQIVRALSGRHGSQVIVPRGEAERFAFPTAAQLAVLTEAELRACKMGFRAPYLLSAARRIVSGEINLAAVGGMELSAAREELMKLDGVGEKIADCVLLFAYGFPKAFPVDVWVRRVLTQFYFRGRNVKPERLRRFIEKHFGDNAGYAQQYLFHHVRITSGKNLFDAGIRSVS